MSCARLGAVALGCALAACGALATAGGAAADAPVRPARPALRLVAQHPRILVQGRGFGPRERITVSVLGARTVSGRVRAAANGGFRITLRRPDTLACGRLLVRAAGDDGSAAFLRLGPPECNPAGDDAGAVPGNR